MTGELVSVLLPCFNAERFLAASLVSILGQTYENLEVLALDDGSSDATPRILEEFAARDPRVRVLPSPENQGLIATLNRGVPEARGGLIARMDADDVAAPTRLQRQAELLAARADVGVVGTGIELIDDDGAVLGTPRIVRCREPGGADFMGLFGPPVVHSALMARAGVMRGHAYGGPDALHTEDYELFTRMLRDGVGFANIDEPLMRVRVSATGVSLSYEDIQIENFVTCARRQFEAALGWSPPPGAHRVFVNRLNGGTTAADLRAGLALLDSVEAEFGRRAPEVRDEIRGIGDEQRLDILVQALRKGSRQLRLAAVPAAIRRARRLASPRARRYLALKLRRLA